MIQSFEVHQLHVGQKFLCFRRGHLVFNYSIHNLHSYTRIYTVVKVCGNILQNKKQKHFSRLLWPYCVSFSIVTPLAVPLIQSGLNGNSITPPTKGVNFFSPLVCVWREGPIISAVWELKRHAYSNLLFHSPGPLSSLSSFPVSYSSYPSTGKPPPAAASDLELSF